MIGLDSAIKAVTDERTYAEVELGRAYARVRELDATIAALKRLKLSSTVPDPDSPTVEEKSDDTDRPPMVGVVPQEEPAPCVSHNTPPAPAPPAHQCEHCARTFGGVHALRVHQARSHPIERRKFDPDAARAAAADAAYGPSSPKGPQ